mmetsp:Transcript_107617/g.229765  ORF Transcript_107617/g.229765 Transcript_107617/m.229765 type:complete len:232 (+) Transcript_107617:878-1573(+)
MRVLGPFANLVRLDGHPIAMHSQLAGLAYPAASSTARLVRTVYRRTAAHSLSLSWTAAPQSANLFPEFLDCGLSAMHYPAASATARLAWTGGHRTAAHRWTAETHTANLLSLESLADGLFAMHRLTSCSPHLLTSCSAPPPPPSQVPRSHAFYPPSTSPKESILQYKRSLTRRSSMNCRPSHPVAAPNLPNILLTPPHPHPPPTPRTRPSPYIAHLPPVAPLSPPRSSRCF